VSVKIRKIPGNLSIFSRKERVNYKILEEGGKVRVKITFDIRKKES